MKSKNEKHQPTMVDAAVGSFSIGLVICMISMLVFFLITVIYRGEFSIRLMYILGLFTFASVLVSRIAIEQSRSLSFVYLSVLSVATLLVTLKFVQFSGPLAILSLPILIGFLGLIVFLADRITFDCTLINEREDSSGEGLLQSLGMVQSQIAATEEDSSERESLGTKLRKSVGDFLNQDPSNEDANDKPKKKSRHNPGVWILYFSLLAIPLFGLGQLFIPAGQVTEQRRAFWFLFFYLLSGLLLLLNTSFLGLRRYLRQRSAPMQSSMTMTWLGSGAIGTLVLLILASLLPLPGHSAGLFDLPKFVTSPTDLKSNKFGWGPEGVEDAESKNKNGPVKPEAKGELSDEQGGKGKANQSSDDGKAQGKDSGGKDPGGEKSDSAQKKPGEQESSENAEQEDSEQGEKDPSKDQKNNEKDQKQSSEKQQQNKAEQQNQLDNEKKNQNKADEQRGGQRDQKQQGNQPQPTQWTSPNMLGGLLKWLTILILAIVILVYAAKNPDQIREMWNSFMDFWRQLFGMKTPERKDLKTQVSASQTLSTATRKPFRSFSNPFANDVVRWRTIDLISYTYEAVQAFGDDCQLSREVDETPEEYLRRMAAQFPEQAKHLLAFANVYNRSAYAIQSADVDVRFVKTIWEWMIRQSMQNQPAHA